MRRTVEERIESRIKKDPSGCWLWQGYLCGGYGRIRILGKQNYIHRVQWELINGPIPKGMFVCHHCDIRNCINIKHLFLGTCKDNLRDMVKKKRQRNNKKQQCIHGHPFNNKNTYYFIGHNNKEWRFCRECHRQNEAKYRAKRKANG